MSLFAVDGNAKGLTRTALSTMDQTRKQAKLEFKGVEAELIGTEGKGWEVLSKVFDLAAVALAAEQVDVVGFVERQGLYDRTGQCVQGETWLQTNRWEFDTGTYRAVTVRRNPANRRIVSTVSPAGGTSTTKGSISDYQIGRAHV